MSDSPAAILNAEMARTRPDVAVYIPRHYDGSTGDGLNEHFLVFDGPDGSLMAVWTQSAAASGLPGGRQINRIVCSRSRDNGNTWRSPTHVAGPKPGTTAAGMASWAFPLVSSSGRIYVVFNRNSGQSGWIRMHTGTMAAVYSNDLGDSWSDPQEVPMPVSPYDDPEGATPPEWIVWQNPIRDLSGGWLAGYTHWVNQSVASRSEVRGWTEIESVVEFMRFTNVDADPDPCDLSVHYSACGHSALRVPHWRYPEVSVAQEPSIVRLPDHRLFCGMRTASGCIWWSQSSDDGRRWSTPRPLLHRDFGRPLLNPVGCDPIYQLADGRYILFYSNNRGNIDAGGSADAGPRRPCFAALGEYRPEAEQPIWFSEPKLFMDTGGHTVAGAAAAEPGMPTNTDLSLYASFTTRGGRDMLWYPDRKFFLLGKEVTGAFLADLRVPEWSPPRVISNRPAERRHGKGGPA